MDDILVQLNMTLDYVYIWILLEFSMKNISRIDMQSRWIMITVQF